LDVGDEVPLLDIRERHLPRGQIGAGEDHVAVGQSHVLEHTGREETGQLGVELLCDDHGGIMQPASFQGIQQQLQVIELHGLGRGRVAHRAAAEEGDLLHADEGRLHGLDLAGKGHRPLREVGRLNARPELTHRRDDLNGITAHDCAHGRGQIGAEVEVAGHDRQLARATFCGGGQPIEHRAIFEQLQPQSQPRPRLPLPALAGAQKRAPVYHSCATCHDRVSLSVDTAKTPKPPDGLRPSGNSRSVSRSHQDQRCPESVIPVAV